ncbi:MAG: molybdopterin oxidoreductase family protein, partial [Halothece sp.]
ELIENPNKILVKFKIEQYIDPEMGTDDYLLIDRSKSVNNIKPLELENGYTLYASKLIQDSAVLTLEKDGSVVKEKKIDKGDFFTYNRATSNGKSTIFLAELSEIFTSKDYNTAFLEHVTLKKDNISDPDSGLNSNINLNIRVRDLNNNGLDQGDKAIISYTLENSNFSKVQVMLDGDQIDLRRDVNAGTYVTLTGNLTEGVHNTTVVAVYNDGSQVKQTTDFVVGSASEESSMGMNQSSEGTAKVRTLIDLHLMTGNIGKPGAGPFSLTGQPNAMGGREAGGLAHILPGYRVVKNPQHRADVEQAWGLPEGRINPNPGRDGWEMIRGLETGEVGLFWVAATNPAVSMPDIERTKKALLKSNFTVCQDAYYPTETAGYAHLVLPAAQWGEKTGTMTNSERVVTLCPAFQNPPGEAKPDWDIFAAVGQRLGFEKEFNFANAGEVYQEFVGLTRDRVCDLSGLSHQRLRDEGPIQWPCPEGETETISSGKRLYINLHFPTVDGRANFAGYHSRGLAEPEDENYPYVLTTGRLYGHWHTQTRTGNIPKITKMHPYPELEVHPRDAKKLGLDESQEETWVEARSRRGKARFRVKITKAIAPGTVFIPMHWGALWADDAEANALTHPESCPSSKQPELKACAVQLIPIN